jgi:hypothetical protein
LEKSGLSPVEDLSDMFEVTKEDVMGDTEEGMDDLTEVSEEDVMGGDEDMSDLMEVSREDIMGPEPEPVPAKDRRRIRIVRHPRVPGTSFGGMQY